MKMHDKKNHIKNLCKVIGSCAIFFLVIYFGIALFFSNHFFWKTLINGHDCSCQTLDEVEEDIKKQLDDYILNIKGKDGKKDAIRGSEISITYQETRDLKSIMEKQKNFLWPEFIFKTKSYNIIDKVSYDEKKLLQKIDSLNILKPESDQIMPQSAFLQFDGNQFVIHPEVDGTIIDKEIFTKKVLTAIEQLELEIDLEKEECYTTPEYTSKSEELQNACQKANQYCDASITYLMDEPVVIDKNMISSWIVVEEDLSVDVDENAIKQWLENFGEKYDTIGTTRDFITPLGKKATVTGGTYGWSIDENREFECILDAIKNGNVISKEPTCYVGCSAAAHTMPDWGNTYAEVDLSEQHMWYISNGVILLDTDVVTGEPIPEKITPEGVYSLLEKGMDVMLRGEIIPETGEPEYLQPVNYWMRITWEGIGFHDATWQGAFGGSLNQIRGIGSHGCINMPLDQAAILYNRIEVGTPVIIHY